MSSVSGTPFAATGSFKRDIPVVASLVDSSIKYTENPQSGSKDTATQEIGRMIGGWIKSVPH